MASFLTPLFVLCNFGSRLPVQFWENLPQDSGDHVQVPQAPQRVSPFATFEGEHLQINTYPLKTPSPGEVNLLQTCRHVAHVTPKS